MHCTARRVPTSDQTLFLKITMFLDADVEGISVSCQPFPLLRFLFEFFTDTGSCVHYRYRYRYR